MGAIGSVRRCTGSHSELGIKVIEQFAFCHTQMNIAISDFAMMCSIDVKRDTKYALLL